MVRLERRLAILCAVAGVLLLFAGAGIWLLERRMSSGLSYALIAGVALLIGYAILDPSAVTDLVRSREARFGTLSVLVTAIVLGILVLLNVIAAQGTQAYDITQARINTLSPLSVKAVRSLDSDLNVVGFYRPADQSYQRDASALLSLYSVESPRVKVRWEDYDRDLQEVRQFGVRIPATLVLQYKGKTQLLTLATQTEQDVTAAILKLESDRTPVVCWAAGEGERDLKETNQSFGYSGVGEQLQKNNFKEKDLLLAQGAPVPADCDVVAIVGPQKPLSAAAVRSADEYLAAGGKLLLVSEPWVDPPVTASLNQLLKPVGATYSGGLVIELDPAHSARDDPTTPAVLSYGSSPITRTLAQVVTFFPQTTSLGGQPNPDYTVIPIAVTSDNSYEIQQPRQRLEKQAGDKAGPFTLMETLEQQTGSRRARLVLVGTGGFAENRTLPPTSADGNLQLVLFSLDWLAEQESLIEIPPKPGRNLPLALTQQDVSVNAFVTVFGLPGLVVVGGLLVWWRRRLTRGLIQP